MPGEPGSETRLARLMNERRLDLGLRWDQVAAISGVSDSGLRLLRRADSVPRELTQRGIERALRWQPGSVLRIISGGDPVSLATETGIPADAPVCSFEQSILGEDGISEETKVQLIRVHRAGGHANCRPAEPQHGRLAVRART